MTDRRRPTWDGPLPTQAALILAVLGIMFLVWLLARSLPRLAPRAPAEPADGYLLTVWNVENLHDDQDDPRDHDPNENWFARDPAAHRAKLDRLVAALRRQNGGRGPDVLALVEVENRRAVDLLRQALNAALPDALDYPESGLIHRDNRTGRRIEPALLSRLPAREARELGTFDGRRILAAEVRGAGGAALRILVGHWTSRATRDSAAKRIDYARALYGAFLTEYRLDPSVDLILCGDFNDGPDDPSVSEALRTTADPGQVIPGDPRPYLLNLVAGLDPRRDGTYLYRGRWAILDHIVVSPGLLDDRGWRVKPGTLRVWNDAPLRGGRGRGPLRFGAEDNPNLRGPSDHFAVSVRLGVSDGPGPAVVAE